MFNKKTIKALEEFVQNVYWAEPLSAEQSIKNLEESLVEILYPNEKHMGNGVLITKDGYFFSAGHMLEEKTPRYIKDYKNRIYPIKKVCQTNEKEDIALFKAKIPKEKVSRVYKIHNTNKLKNFRPLEFPINLKSRWDGKIENKYGCLLLKYVITKKFDYRNQFGTDIHPIAGDSGGIIISKAGELVGFVSNGFKEETEFDICDNLIIKSYCSKIFSGLNLVVREINSLKGF